MGSLFQRAMRRQVFLRMMVLGVSGAGKTYSALGVARGLAGDSGRIAVLDSERGSSRLYSDIFGFDVAEIPDIEIGSLGRPEGRYAPERYIEGIRAAESAGYDVLVVDSLTHAWSGEGGVMEIVDYFAQGKFKGNSFAAWSIATPIWRQLLDTMIAARMHIIVTGRSKTEWLETENKGKKNFERVGTKAELREGAEFEFDLVGELDLEHHFRVVKTRYSVLAGQVVPRPGREFGARLHGWLRGEMPSEQAPATFGRALYEAARVDIPTAAAYCRSVGKPSPMEMAPEQRDRFIAYLRTSEGKARLDRWLFDTESPRVTSSEPEGWPAGEAAEHYRGGDDEDDDLPSTETPPSPPPAPVATAHPAAPVPRAAHATPAPPPPRPVPVPVPPADTRALLGAVRTERQSVGEETFLDACQALGIDPTKPAAAGYERLSALLSRLQAAGFGHGDDDAEADASAGGGW